MEALVAFAVLLIGSLGVVALRIATIRANFSGDRMIQASALATDLEESVKRWDYNDSRLSPTSGSISGSPDGGMAVPQSTWDMGSSQTASYTANYSDFATGNPVFPSNASSPNVLGTTYPGLSSDVEGTGTPAFFRFWNVYSVGSGPDGKLVQIIVRWMEPGGVWRQVATSTFKRNPGVF